MSNITFVIFTFNEEKRIEYAIRNFINYGEVLIMDGGSTDKTKEIAEKLGAKFFSRPLSNRPQVETQEIFDFIKDKVKTDWIYWGYVDNFAPKTLLDKFVEISSQNVFKVVVNPLYTYLWGNTKNFAHKGGTQVFFHKNYISFVDNNMHNMGRFIGKKDELLRLPNRKEFALIHFSTYNIGKFVAGHLKYAEAEALDKQKDGKKFNTTRMLAAMIYYCFIFCKNGYKNGILGLIAMLSYAFSRFMVYVKLYELEKGITMESIENNYSKMKKEMLKEFEDIN